MNTAPIPTAAEARRDADILAIARTHSSLTTLESRGSDALDFHDLSVWTVKAMLRSAWEAGRRDAAPRPTRRTFGERPEDGDE